MKKMTFSARGAWVFVLALLAMCGGLEAQQLFAPLPANAKQQLSSKAADLLGQYRKMERFEAVNAVDFGVLSQLGNDRRVEVVLAEGEEPVGFDLQTIEYRSEDNWYLYGSLDKAGFAQHPEGGEIMLRSQDGEKFGTVQVGETFFRVDALDGKNSVLLRNAPPTAEELTATDCGHLEQAEEEPETDASSDLPESTARFGIGCKVRVLMLYSPALLAVIPNMNNHAQTHIDQINQAIAVSDVGSTELRFELAGVRLISGFTERDKSAFDVLGEMNGNASVQQYRQVDHADLVCLVVNHTIADFNGVGGVAYVNAHPSRGFSVMREFRSLPLKIFPHEVGHSMGCNHENGPSTRYNRAYEFDRLVSLPGQPAEYQTYRTLMRSLGSSSNLLRYSNPIVPYLGGPTGTATNNNVRVLKERACTVAGFMPEAPTMSASICGDEQACPGIGEACFPSTVTGGSQSIITYQWSWSLNGANYTNFSTAQHPCLSMANFLNGQTLTIRLVASSGNLSATAFHTLQVTNNAPGGCLFWGKVAPVTALGLTVSPNPMQGKGSIEVLLPEADRVELALYDLSGKRLFDVLGQELVAGPHKVPFDASKLAQGTYLLELKTSDSRLQQRLVIAH